jgi:hypothetical protein
MNATGKLPQFAVSIGSRVAIRGAETEGTVTAIMLENDGMQYRVVYWHDGVRRCEWLYGFELGQTVSA